MACPDYHRCDPLQDFTTTRRRFLTSSASGLGMAALAALFQQEGLLAADKAGPRATGGPGRPGAPHHKPRATACIFLFMGGGMSQLDMFDPKPLLREHAGKPLPESARQGIRLAFIGANAGLRPSSFDFSKHGASGMDFSELLPHLAQRADDICMIRSTHGDAFNHLPGQLMMNTGYQQSGYPSVGSWVTYGIGSFSRNLPMYVVLGGKPTGGPNNYGNGFLPTHYQGVPFRDSGEPILYLQNPRGVTDAAQTHSVEAMRQLTELQQHDQDPAAIDSAVAQYELAFRMQTSGPELVKIDAEPQWLRESYGIESRTGRDRSFATNCMLARRLVERGVRFVTVFDGGWDQHDKLDEALTANCRRIDQPIAALLADLKQRGMLDSTLVVCASEFGRTPITQGAFDNPSGGRDHHPYAFTTLMAGGGVKPGHIHGASDEFGWRVASDGVHIHDLHATILHLMGIDHERLTYTHRGRRFRLTDVHGHVVQPILT